MDGFSPADWERQAIRQAGWTREARLQLYRQVGLPRARAVLDAGCGTGTLTEEIAALTAGLVVGLDLAFPMLAFARQRRGVCARYVQGDVLDLPFAGGSFDAATCHYLLLWLDDAARGVREMARVTRPGGWVLVTAEPDYGGRVDYPPELAPLGRWQAAALARQGADPQMGRRVRALLSDAGLEQVGVGVLAGQWQGRPDPAEWAAEWEVLQRDLAGSAGRTELQRLRALDQEAVRAGRRVLFVPTFYGWGQRP